MLSGIQEELADAQSQLETLVGPYTEAANLNIANLTGLNLSAVSEKVQAAGLQLGKSAFETLSTFAMPEKVRPGRDLREGGYRPKHPVIIIPGAALTSFLPLARPVSSVLPRGARSKASGHYQSRSSPDLYPPPPAGFPPPAIHHCIALRNAGLKAA